MVEDLTCIFPRELLPDITWVGRQGRWLYPDVAEPITERDVLLPSSVYRIDWDKVRAMPHSPEKVRFVSFLERFNRHEGLLTLGFFEAGGVLTSTGPKLFRPTHEQFESMGNVDLHIPISDFRSPYPALIVRIPNEWRLTRSRELGIDVQRQPQYVLVRTSATPAGKVHILCVLRYPEVEHFNVVTDQKYHKDLESAFRYVANYVKKTSIKEYTEADCSQDEKEFYRIKTLEYQYCTDAIHCALNCCLMMVHFGHREGAYLDARVHQSRCKRSDPLRHADFKAVDMVQNVVIRQSAAVGDFVPGAVGDGVGETTGESGREVRPHWRRGHWRRKPGWQVFVERNEKPPLSFVRPCLVRKDRIVGDVGDSQTAYTRR